VDRSLGCCLNLKFSSAVLGVPLRSLRLSCHLTQRAQRYTENAENSFQFKTTPSFFRTTTTNGARIVKR